MRKNFKLNGKYLIFSDIALGATVFLASGLFKIENVLAVTYVLMIPYFSVTNRKRLTYYLVIASSISFGWMLVSKKQYINNSYYLADIGINMYPILGWSLGLVGTYALYSYFESKYKVKKFGQRLALYLSLYWPALIFFETFGYHILYIRNPATVGYSGLPFCDCIHAPAWMQAVYLGMGPLFFIVAYFIHNFRNDLRGIWQKIVTVAFEDGSV